MPRAGARTGRRAPGDGLPAHDVSGRGSGWNEPRGGRLRDRVSCARDDRRAPARSSWSAGAVSWLKAAVSWSTAAVWSSQAAGRYRRAARCACPRAATGTSGCVPVLGGRSHRRGGFGGVVPVSRTAAATPATARATTAATTARPRSGAPAGRLRCGRRLDDRRGYNRGRRRAGERRGAMGGSTSDGRRAERELRRDAARRAVAGAIGRYGGWRLRPVRMRDPQLDRAGRRVERRRDPAPPDHEGEASGRPRHRRCVRLVQRPHAHSRHAAVADRRPRRSAVARP